MRNSWSGFLLVDSFSATIQMNTNSRISYQSTLDDGERPPSLEHMFGHINFPTDPTPQEIHETPRIGCTADEAMNPSLASHILAMFVGYTGLVLALHREMQYQATVDTTPLPLHDSRRHDRTAFLWQKVHDMAIGALQYVVRITQLIPTPPHIMHINWSGIVGWAHFCLAEADAAGGIPNDSINIFDRVIGI
ncbi:hypothetical protein B0H17DRAFT_450517 [Mycena rosella]|uniref:Uncharacterized protein n=1 Tax=Mycena rosella TaxID=1033263 RepID=A0AAD7GYK4_MYCRO|nr:hypothetical protein B0H17DRAFT_450517 [Mycena rosella]